MKYQALKRLKTKTKVLKVCDTLAEAHELIRKDGAIFHSFSFIGGFPLYERPDESGQKYYSIQGKHDTLGLVLSIGKEELSAFNFNQ